MTMHSMGSRFFVRHNTIILGVLFFVFSFPSFLNAAPGDLPPKGSLGFRPGHEGITPPEEVRPKVKLDLEVPEGGKAFRKELEQIKIQLNKVDIQGITIYPEEEIKALYQDMLGKEISLADVYDLEENITQKYRRDGYVLSRALIPEQRIQKGVVKVFVVEGFINQVKIEGEESIQPRIMAFLDKIIGRKPLKIQDLERYLLLVNDMAGVRTQNIIRPAEDTPGASELVVIPERKKLGAFLTYDNYGSNYIGPDRLIAGVSLNSLLNYGERFTLIGLVANPESEMTYLQGQANIPIGAEGLMLNLSIAEGPSEPDDELKELETESWTYSKSVSLSYPLIRSRNTNLIIEGGYEHMKYIVHVLDQSFTEDRAPKFYVKGTLDFVDGFAGANTISLRVNQGLDWSATQEDDPYSSRPEAAPKFTTFSGELQRIQYLDNLLPGLSLMGKVLWQFSDEPLLASEEFGIGGRTVGRGFDEAELLGDKGVGFSAELQYLTPTYKDFYAQFYGFFDAGKVWNHDIVYENTDNEKPDLESAGVGIRVFWKENVTLHFEVAKPLSRVPLQEDDRDPRYYMGVVFSY